MTQITTFISRKTVFTLALLLLLLGTTPFLFYGTRLLQRPSRSAIQQKPLYQGVTYSRFLQQAGDNPVLFHVIEIDLTTPDLTFHGTESNGDQPYDTNAQTVGEFVTNTDALLAINGSFFNPFHSDHPLDYYPHAGDPVNVQGYAITNGTRYSDDHPEWATLCLQNRAATIQQVTPCPENTTLALSGHLYLIQEGVQQPSEGKNRYPRTAVALNPTANKMWWIVADGKQPYYSHGATLDEMATAAFDLGATELLIMMVAGRAHWFMKMKTAVYTRSTHPFIPASPCVKDPSPIS